MGHTKLTWHNSSKQWAVVRLVCTLPDISSTPQKISVYLFGKLIFNQAGTWILTTDVLTAEELEAAPLPPSSLMQRVVI